ncbi:MAG: hypothetical protein WA970_15170 [Gammaproteobacteria bacterium]
MTLGKAEAKLPPISKKTLRRYLLDPEEGADGSDEGVSGVLEPQLDIRVSLQQWDEHHALNCTIVVTDARGHSPVTSSETLLYDTLHMGMLPVDLAATIAHILWTPPEPF